MKRWWIGVVLAFAVGAPKAMAQQVDLDRLDVPRAVADRVLAFFDSPETVVYDGQTTIGLDEIVSTDVGVLGGSLIVDGRIEGDVMVVDGNVTLAAGAVITGDLTIVGGRFIGENTSIQGAITVYAQRAPAEARRDERRNPVRPDRYRYGVRNEWTRSRISIRSENSYNRVEGLPIMVGPVIEAGRSVSFRVDALAVVRTENEFDFDRENLGYYLRAEQRFGRRTGVTLGATAYSVIDPIERWGLGDIEASLATFVLHQDYRDYFEREGFSIFAHAYMPLGRVRLEAVYRDEDHAFVPAGDPWTLRHYDDAWRAQPLIAQGRSRSVEGRLVVDDRNDPENPLDGWYLEAKVLAGLGGSLEVPGYLVPEPGPARIAGAARSVDPEFRAGFVDFRWYARVGPSSGLRTRGLFAGSLDRSPLPPQFQHALGGEGSLPGHRLFALDCGARSGLQSVIRGADRIPAYPAYGCDRVALVQAEYRSSFSLDFGWGDGDGWDADSGWYPSVNVDPSWALFFDAGRGWTLSEPDTPGYLGPDTDTLMDVGVGFFVGDVGLYWAWPLNGPDKGMNFFLRIDHRF